MITTQSSGLLLVATVSLITAIFTFLWIKIARKLMIFDAPGQRRLHTEFTPRAGGVAIFIVLFLGVLFFAESSSGKKAFLAGLLSIAIVGFLDDLAVIGSRMKLLGQIISLAIAGVFFQLDSNLLIILFVLLGLLSINLWNFMDGSNGMIASQAILGASFVAAAVYSGPFQLSGLLALLILASCLGFLPFNLKKKALVFLGDTGSHVLGYCVCFLIFVTYQDNLSVTWLIIGSTLPIWADSLTTLAWRAWKKKNIFRAHREHLYQWLVRAGYSHAIVMAGYVLFSALTAFLLIKYGNTVLLLSSIIFFFGYWIIKWKISSRN
jgi:UDP-N-acetylmuramyl pentapeptide phosphotransferase/UDP-N-acetylglucosamine-1-phosphate transferase